MPQSLHPRLIRPERDGKVGEWLYLFKVNGQEFIFPALVNELGKLEGIFQSERRDEPSVPEGPPRVPTAEELSYMTKVIYWKASEWEEKFLPLAVEWTRKHGFTMPDVPFNRMEFRKIEDRDGEDRVAEVINVTALPQHGKFEHSLCIYQFRAIDGEQGDGKKPLMQWWAEGYVEFKEDGRLRPLGWGVPSACERLADWGEYPQIVRDMIDEKGPGHAFQVLTLPDRKEKEVTDDELRAVTIWIAFCLYINSMKTTYIEGGEPSRRKSAPRTLEEAVALEQATVLKSAGILKSGVRRRNVLNPGSGTKHRYRYLVRGHERVINGKAIWVKPQIRGQGEFMVLPTATTPEIQVAIPETPVTVNVPAKQLEEPTKVLLLPAPRQSPPPAPRPRLRQLLTTAFRLLSSLLRSL